MCAIQRVNGQDKRLKCLGMGYGSRCHAHLYECVVSRTAAGFFTLNSFLGVVYQKWSTSQITSSQLDRTVGCIGVNMGQHPCNSILQYEGVPDILYNKCMFWLCQKLKGYWDGIFNATSNITQVSILNKNINL